MSTTITTNNTVIVNDEPKVSTILSASSITLYDNIYDPINDPTGTLQKIVKASIIEATEQAQPEGSGLLGLVISQEVVTESVTLPQVNKVLASYTTDGMVSHSTPISLNGGSYSGAKVMINQFSNDLYDGGFGSKITLDASTSDIGGAIPFYNAMTIQNMAHGQTPYSSIEFDGARSSDSIMQIKMTKTYDESNNLRNAKSTLKLPLQYGTDPDFLVTGTYGSAGQVLTTGGQYGTLSWSTPSGSQTLAEVLTAGSVGDSTQTITLSDTSGTNVLSGSAISMNDSAYTSFLAIRANDINLTNGDASTYLDIYNNAVSMLTPSITVTGASSQSVLAGNSLNLYNSAGDINNTLLVDPYFGFINTYTDAAECSSGPQFDTTIYGSYIYAGYKDDVNPLQTIELQAGPSTTYFKCSGDIGTSGQVLTSGGSSGLLSWTTPSSGSPTLQNVLDTGNSATDTNINIQSTSSSFFTTVDYNGVHIVDTAVKLELDGDNNGMLWTDNKLIIAPRGGAPSGYGFGGAMDYNMGFNGLINIPESTQRMGINYIYDPSASRYLDLKYLDTGSDRNGLFLSDVDTVGNVIQTEISTAQTGSNSTQLIMTKKSGSSTVVNQMTLNQDSMVIADTSGTATTMTLNKNSLSLVETGVYSHDIKTDSSSNYLDINSTVGLNIGSDLHSASIVNVGHGSTTGITQSTTNLYGDISIQGNLYLQGNTLFSGGDSGGIYTVSSFTVPANAGRNSLYTAFIVGASNPTPVTLPTDDTGGKYIYLYNAGTNPILISGSSTRKIYGTNCGTAGATSIPLYINQNIGLLSTTSGFLILSLTNPNNTPSTPYYLQTSSINQRQSAQRITSFTGSPQTVTFSVAFSAVPSVVLSPLGGSNVALASQSASGFTFTYTSTPTAVNWCANGTY